MSDGLGFVRRGNWGSPKMPDDLPPNSVTFMAGDKIAMQILPGDPPRIVVPVGISVDEAARGVLEAINHFLGRHLWTTKP